jgi:hypothetical protein
MICNTYRLDDAVLDLGADDGAGIKKQKSVYHWDKVMLNSRGLIVKKTGKLICFSNFMHNFPFISYKPFAVRGVKSTSS